jgi:hypothetical protein
MASLVKTTTHASDALDRLPEQYRAQPKIASLISISAARSQELEDALYDLLSKGSLSDAEGPILDQLGEIVGIARSGYEDAKYKIRILAKIGQNISNGLPEDLISIFKLLMQADRVYYSPLYPAAAYLTAIGTDPVGTIEEIRAALEDSHAGGVSIDYFVVVDAASFSFLADPDPSGQGFGDVDDAEVGGTLATLF